MSREKWQCITFLKYDRVLRCKHVTRPHPLETWLRFAPSRPAQSQRFLAPDTRNYVSMSDRGSPSPRRSRSRSHSRSPSPGAEDEDKKSPRPDNEEQQEQDAEEAVDREASRRSPSRSRSRSPAPAVRAASAAKPDVGNPGNNLYVANLATKVGQPELQEIFAKFGRVDKCEVIVDPVTRESRYKAERGSGCVAVGADAVDGCCCACRGFGFVTFEDVRDAEDAVKELNKCVAYCRQTATGENGGG